METSNYPSMRTGIGARRAPHRPDPRPLWVVRYSDFALEFPAPSSVPGLPDHSAHYAYVLIDAMNGRVIDIQYWE